MCNQVMNFKLLEAYANMEAVSIMTYQPNQESISFDYKMQVEVSGMSESAFIEASIDLLMLA